MGWFVLLFFLNVTYNVRILTEYMILNHLIWVRVEVQQWNRKSSKYNSFFHLASPCLPVGVCESGLCVCMSSRLMKSPVLNKKAAFIHSKNIPSTGIHTTLDISLKGKQWRSKNDMVYTCCRVRNQYTINANSVI